MFVDLHIHALPGVDDGPGAWEEALEMLRRAAAAGTEVAVLTPHGLYRGRPQDPERLRSLCAQLSRALEGQGPTLLLGMENLAEPSLLERARAGQALTLNGSPYMLVELPFTQLPLYWEEVLFQLQLQGFIPLLAHPERQAQFQEDPTLVGRLVERGVLTQLTAGSLAGHFGPRARRTAEALLRRGWAHALASDAHFPQGPRDPDMREGFRQAVRLLGRERALRLVREVPRAIVAGEEPPALE